MPGEKANELLKDRALGPIASTDDIVNRGIWLNKTIPESAVDGLPFIPRIASKILTDILGGHLIIEKGRAPVPAYTESRGAKLRSPDYIYPKFMTLSKVHWLLRTIIRAIIGEVLTPGWTAEARYRHKCTNCGKEYDNPDIKECEVCEGKDFDKPDVDQYKLLRQLMGDDGVNQRSLVGEGRTFKEFLFSTLWYGIALDDWYWELGYPKEYDTEQGRVVSVPKAVRVLDGSVTFPLMDDWGGFSSPEYFCPACYKETWVKHKFDYYVDIRTTPNVNPDTLTCQYCGGQLIRTGYVQKVDGKVVVRFGKDEVIHASTSRIDPEVFGLSKIIAAVKLLYIIDYMDEYNLQIHRHGHASKILGIEGADQQKAEEMQTFIQNQIRGRTQTDSRTGETTYNLEPILVILGLEQGKRLSSIDIAPKLTELQSLEFYKLYVEKISGLFGVSPVFISASEEGGTETRPRIDVQNHITRQWMTDVEEPFNNFLLPRFGVTDWVLRFGKVESRDELREREIKQRVGATVAIYEALGHDVEVREDGMDFTVSPKAVRPSEAALSRQASMRTSQTDADPANTDSAGTGKEPRVNTVEQGEEK